MRFGRGKSILGVDIGSHSIKVVEIKHTEKGPIIIYAQSTSIPQAKGDELDKEEATCDTLRGLVSRAKLRGKHVVTSVPAGLDDQVTMRSIFIPNLPADAPRKALQVSVQAEFEAQQYITYNEDAQVDFCVEGEITLNGVRGLEVFVVAVYRELIEKRVQLLRDCGLAPVGIDVDFLALARLIAVTRQFSKAGDIALLDIGGDKTSIGFYQQHKLLLYPHIPMAGNQLTTQLAQHLDTDWDAAEACKHTQAEEPEISALLEASLDQELYQQLYVHFDAYEREFPESRPTKTVLSGGTAQLSGLNQFLDARLAVPTDELHYLADIAVDTKRETAALKGNEPLFATAVGLALKQIQ